MVITGSRSALRDLASLFMSVFSAHRRHMALMLLEKHRIDDDGPTGKRDREIRRVERNRPDSAVPN